MIGFRARNAIYICIPIFALLCTMAYAQDWGDVKCTDRTVNVRSDRSVDSAVVCRLKPGDLVKADFLEGSWWAVFKLYETVRSEENAIGYVYAPLLKPVSQKNMRVWSGQSDSLQK